MKERILESLKGDLEEKIKDIETRLFMLDMKDTWEQADFLKHDTLVEIKKELEEMKENGK